MGQEGGGSRAAEVMEDAAAAGELDDVVDDQEVGAKPESSTAASSRRARWRSFQLRPLAEVSRSMTTSRRLRGKRSFGGRDDVVEGEFALPGDLEGAGEGLADGRPKRRTARASWSGRPGPFSRPAGRARAGTGLCSRSPEEDQPLGLARYLRGFAQTSGSSAAASTPASPPAPEFRSITRLKLEKSTPR